MCLCFLCMKYSNLPKKYKKWTSSVQQHTLVLSDLTQTVLSWKKDVLFKRFFCIFTVQHTERDVISCLYTGEMSSSITESWLNMWVYAYMWKVYKNGTHFTIPRQTGIICILCAFTLKKQFSMHTVCINIKYHHTADVVMYCITYVVD